MIVDNDYYSCFLSPFRITPRRFDMVPASEPQSAAQTTCDLRTHSGLTLSKRGTRTSFTFRKIRHEPCRCGEIVGSKTAQLSLSEYCDTNKFLTNLIVLFGEINILRASCSQDSFTCIKTCRAHPVKVFSPFGIPADLQAEIKMEFLGICIIGMIHILPSSSMVKNNFNCGEKKKKLST